MPVAQLEKEADSGYDLGIMTDHRVGRSSFQSEPVAVAADKGKR